MKKLIFLLDIKKNKKTLNCNEYYAEVMQLVFFYTFLYYFYENDLVVLNRYYIYYITLYNTNNL